MSKTRKIGKVKLKSIDDMFVCVEHPNGSIDYVSKMFAKCALKADIGDSFTLTYYAGVSWSNFGLEK